MNAVDHLVSKFGSQERLAKAAGASQSSVSDWKRTGRIPSARQSAILRNAEQFGVEVTPDDFFPDWQASRTRTDACRTA